VSATDTATRTVAAAAIYCRISLDKSGDGLAIERQEALCRELADRLGWPVAEVYVDQSVSAYSGAKRPAYGRMLSDLEAGRRDAVLVVDLDRLVRRTAELATFIDLADRHRVALANVAGDLDLSTSDGRLRARIMGAVAEHEGERKGERMRREREQHARAGKPHHGGGARPFGFEADRVTVVAVEADALREAAAAVLRGESLASIAKRWNADPDAAAKPVKRDTWDPASIATALRAPRVAGLRAYRGEVVGDAVWAPIIDRATWERVRAALDARRPNRGPGRPAREALVGLARCGRCGAPLWASRRSTGRRAGEVRYACVSGPARPEHCGGITIAAGPLDELVRDAIVEALAADGGAGLARALGNATGGDEAMVAAAAELDAAEREKEALAEDRAAGLLDRREWAAARAVVQQRITDAQAVLDRGAGGVLADLPTDPDALRAEWEARSIEGRRAIIEALIGRVVVHPAPRPGRVDPRERTEIDWIA
jgi:site-specific DNA recombinase